MQRPRKRCVDPLHLAGGQGIDFGGPVILRSRICDPALQGRQNRRVTRIGAARPAAGG